MLRHAVVRLRPGRRPRSPTCSVASPSGAGLSGLSENLARDRLPASFHLLPLSGMGSSWEEAGLTYLYGELLRTAVPYAVEP